MVKNYSFFLIIIAFFTLIITTTAQDLVTPQGINYQAIARDNDGKEYVGAIGVKFAILTGNPGSFKTEWEETHDTLTNQFGLFTVIIGKGTKYNTPLAASFASIDWGSGPHYLDVAIKINGSNTYTNVNTTLFMSVPYALHAANATSGIDGKTILNGTGTPTTEGTIGDFYMDNLNKLFFGPKTAAGWGQGVSIAGKDGKDGKDGVNGVDGSNGKAGSVILSGNVPPVNTSGINGDYYIDTVTAKLYGPKSAGSWPITAVALKGKDGINGSVLYSDTATKKASMGDYFLNKSTYSLYGPKTLAGWGVPISLKGANGNTILNGANNPDVTKGNAGDFYIDTVSKLLYGPKTTTAWGNPTRLKGLLTNGTAAAQTPYWNGTSWIIDNALSNTGNAIGIGTAQPKRKLHVFEATNTFNQGLALDGGSGGFSLDFITSGGDGKTEINNAAVKGWQFKAFGANETTTLLRNDLKLTYYDGGISSDLLYFDNSGRVGIGTSSIPSNLFSVGGTNGNFIIDANGWAAAKNITTQGIVLEPPFPSQLLATNIPIDHNSYVRVVYANSLSTVSNPTVLTLDPGQNTGQIVVIECAKDPFKIKDGLLTNDPKLAGDMIFELNDVLTLIWNGFSWIELSRSKNK
jgi:hypothetical protein